MTQPGGNGVFGGYKYESAESRTLGNFESDKFAYKDQGKNLGQLNNAVGYMSAMMRKMQRGIDSANQNPIQQIQGFISDFIIMLGGGGDTGLDFGDLKYVIQGLGALFGFSDGSGGITVPLNLFSAAWHFFTNFIGITDNFRDLIDQLIDAAISTILDLFGEVPIIGQALQQLAVIISDIRDLLDPIVDAVQAFFTAFDIDLGAIGGAGAIGDFFGPFKPIVDALLSALEGVILPDFAGMFHILAQWSTPFVMGLANIIDQVANVIRAIFGGLGLNNFNNGQFNIIAMISSFINNILANIPFIGLGFLSNTESPNLLVAPGFDQSDSINPGTGWVWDNTAGHTTIGCAKATAGGLLRELVSVPVAVTAGQSVNINTWIKWTGIAYTGVPITVNVNRYMGTTMIGTVQIAAPASPAVNQATWLNFTGSYTVPSDCDTVKLSFRVSSTTTAGSVYFDDAILTKSGTTIPQNWIFNLIPDLSSITHFINDVIDTIITVISGIPFIGGTLANLLSWLTDWFDDTTVTAAQAGDALLVATTIEPIVYTTVTDVTVVQSKAVAQQNYSISSATDSPKQPSYVSKYPISDVSFPESWINRTDVFGTTDAASAGTAHTHTLNLASNVYSSPAGYIIANGNSRGVFLNITNTTAFDHMRLYAWVPSGTATDVTYGLHRVRADGSSYEVISAIQISSQLSAASGFIDVDLGGVLIVQAGETYLLRVTNRSAAGVAVSAVTQTSGATLNGFATTGLTLSNATSYTTAQITTGNNATAQMSFGGLFRAATFYTPKTYTDDFNRPDFGALWVPWANSFGAGSPQLHIDFVAGEGRAAYTGTVDGDESNVYMLPSGSDQTVVAADMWGLSGTARCGIFCHASREANQLAYLGVSNTGANLYAGAWGTLGTAKTSFGASPVDGMNWGIYVDDTGAHDIFHIMRNNIDVAAWTDSTDIMKVGSDFRYGGKIISRISGVNAGEIDNWTMKDVA